MQVLHAHQRRAPAQNVLGSVHVGMLAVTTGNALEDRLALAAFGVNGPARRARLRGIGRVDGHQRAATFLHLVAEHDGEAAPALRENASVEAGFGPDVPPWLFDRPARRGSHVLDLQILEHDRCEAARNIERDAVLPVAANARDAGG